MDTDSGLMQGIRELLEQRQTSPTTHTSPQQTKRSNDWTAFRKFYEGKLAEYGIDGPTDLETMCRVAAHATEGDKGFMYGGSVGNGKTTRLMFMSEVMGIAYSDARTLAIECAGLKPSSDLFAELCNLQAFGTIIGDPYHRKYDIIIDDLGTEGSTQSHYGNRSDVMATIIDARYRQFKDYGWRTFFATNLPSRELKSSYGERTYSRLMEMCQLIALPGGDRRMAR